MVQGLLDYPLIYINDLVFFAENARSGVSYVFCGRNSSKEDEERLIIRSLANHVRMQGSTRGFRKTNPG